MAGQSRESPAAHHRLSSPCSFRCLDAWHRFCPRKVRFRGDAGGPLQRRPAPISTLVPFLRRECAPACRGEAVAAKRALFMARLAFVLGQGPLAACEVLLLDEVPLTCPGQHADPSCRGRGRPSKGKHGVPRWTALVALALHPPSLRLKALATCVLQHTGQGAVRWAGGGRVRPVAGRGVHASDVGWWVRRVLACVAPSTARVIIVWDCHASHQPAAVLPHPRVAGIVFVPAGCTRELQVHDWSGQGPSLAALLRQQAADTSGTNCMHCMRSALHARVCEWVGSVAAERAVRATGLASACLPRARRCAAELDACAGCGGALWRAWSSGDRVAARGRPNLVFAWHEQVSLPLHLPMSSRRRYRSGVRRCLLFEAGERHVPASPVKRRRRDSASGSTSGSFGVSRESPGGSR